METQHGLRIDCECGRVHLLGEEQILSVAGSIWHRKRRGSGPRKKKLVDCPYCHVTMGTFDLMLHKSKCDKRFTVAPGLFDRQAKKKVYRECKYCHQQFSAMELRAHMPDCPKRLEGIPANMAVQ